jgi:nucleotide-binding universal stress UspA family protein
MVPSTTNQDADADGSFNNIICAVDFSPASDRAVRRALSLAQQSRGRVRLLHVLEGSPYESVYSGSRAFRLIAEYPARVERVRRELRSRVPSDALNWCEVDTEAVSGVPREAIVAMALARSADLIVIGVPPRTMLRRIVMGSTVAAVLRHARCAVLAVPARTRATDMRPESMPVREDENEPGTTLISPGTLRGIRDMSTHSAEGG